MKQYTLLFLVRKGEILLALKKRGFGQGKWNGVGGKVEPGETLEQAAVRECQEEIGVTPQQFELVAINDFLYPDKDIQGHVYICSKWQGEPVETEEMKPRWFKLGDIPYDKMWQDDTMWLPFVLTGKHVRCSFTFDSGDNICAADIEMVSFPKESE
ncbi:MAG TPA: 8-oxo-dGTP diphosphatase [Patescibacteria group bacterium]|nr:8-oxo-dGTP diphosphatase [Patescibacteria group bacterium]